MRFVGLDVGFVKDDLFGVGEEEIFAGEAVFEGVEGSLCLTLRSGWSAGFLGVLSVSSETGF